MCDQTEVSYLEDDVVWVKIGPIWWPGMVKDLEKDEEGRQILATFKKKPIAVVKFFQEDNYEFVKNLDHIYHYSCRRKDEFIKKGLDKFRTGATHMVKFPDDVTTAESLTNGDINIINSPKFLPEKKESYSEIFGSGKKKKKDSEKSHIPRARTTGNVTPYRPITHQRFINKALHGESDHSVKTLIQSSTSQEESTSKNSYKCHICKFETSRVNVIVAHHRLSHSPNSINWTGSDRAVVKRPVPKPRKIKIKKISETYKDDESDEEVPDKKKPKIKSSKEKVKTPDQNKSDASSPSPLKKKNKEDIPDVSDSKKPRFTDVLLADWNEEEEEEKKSVQDSKENEEESLDGKENKVEDNSIESVITIENAETPVSKKNQSEKMSCFDFDEEEEGFIGMSNAHTYGRKIPRVIPIKDKTELGMDLEIEELFKRRSETESPEDKEYEDKEENEKKKEVDEKGEIKEVDEKEKIKEIDDKEEIAEKEEKDDIIEKDDHEIKDKKKTIEREKKKHFKVTEEKEELEVIDKKGEIEAIEEKGEAEVIGEKGDIEEKGENKENEEKEEKAEMDEKNYEAEVEEVEKEETKKEKEEKHEKVEKKVKETKAENEEKEVEENVSKSFSIETNENYKKRREKKDKVPFLKTVKRKSKPIKEEEPKTSSENSLAKRRGRRPGAKKSYLNEIIEKIEDEDDNKINERKEENLLGEMNLDTFASKESKAESSSSRRKQDFKNQTMEGDREEMIYSGIVNIEKTRTLTEHPEKRKRNQQKDSAKESPDDLTAQIDNLLEETKLPTLPDVSEPSVEKNESVFKSEDSNSNLSVEYISSEQNGKRNTKSKEMKSISRLFSGNIPSPDTDSEQIKDSQKELVGNSTVGESVMDDGSQSKALSMGNLKLCQSPQKRALLSALSSSSETSGQVKVLPVVRQGSSKDCIVIPSGKKFELKKTSGDNAEQNVIESETSVSPKTIKTIKVKSDSIPSSLIAAGKLKGQTIIHQKGGKYVIVTQPPPSIRQRATAGKSGSKVVILTNQLGEQKIITTSSLAQNKFKTTESERETGSSASSSSSGAQPVIKMVPDGKGGIMKQLSVSPTKKVILGGTKVLVSGSGTSFSGGNTVQKITLAGSATKTGGDFRLIENYKGSGKTVLIQGGPGSTSGVVLKSTGVPRQVTKVLQNPQAISALKKKPKILMRASTSQGEYLMQSSSGSIDTPTYIVKPKGADGKYSAQKIVRTEIVNQPKIGSSGTKAFFVSGQGANKKGESFIIKTNDAVPGKVIRMRQKLKEVDIPSGKPSQKVMQKSQEVYAISQSSLLIPSQSTAESETPQIVQIQEQPRQPVLQTQVIAMPGPVGADGNQTYVLVSVDEHGVVQGVDNSVVAFDTTAQQNQLFVNSTTTNNVILINPQPSGEATPVFSTSSQDILAEALANTNVLEGNLNNEMESVVPSMLLPPAIPSSVVQETSITLQKPIMTPLEMPSSVTPDTSGLEPPPLPPTPTEEDVLMEETEQANDGEAAQENAAESKKEEEITSNDAIQTYLQSENFDVGGDTTEPSFEVHEFQKDDDNQKLFDEHFDDVSKPEETGESETKENEFYQSEEVDENKLEPEENKEPPQEDFIIENSQEEQSTNSFQSMPLLNDEPDTSDDAQGSEPIADQQFDAQKSRMDAEQFSQLIREQEPPSSTNNDIVNENSGGGFGTTTYGSYDHGFDTENMDMETKNKDGGIKMEEQNNDNGEAKEKEPVVVITAKESQSMPLLADESNVNTYDMDSLYNDVLSQKRIQEETEVSSTTDEYVSKDIEN